MPTPNEVSDLVRDKIITQEEAWEILFSEETEATKTTEELKTEIKFLKELVEKLADNNKIVETIRYIEKPYYQWGWYQPYQVWCGTSGSLTVTNTSAGTGGSVALTGASSNTLYTSSANTSFSAI